MTLELFNTFKASIKTSLKNSNDPTSDGIQNVYSNEKDFDVEIKKAFLDQSFRNYLTEELVAEPDKSNLEACKALISLSILAAKNELCSPAVPIYLLADVFDVITLDRCEVLFSYVESNISIWKDQFFFQAIRNNLLRICNDLLRRLSRSQNTVFCGRILVFLAKFFPFSERSGLNVVSEFNLENTTVFSTEEMESGIGETNGDNHMEVDEEESPVAKKIKIEEDQQSLLIDYALYSKFWQLQDFFRNPVQCYDKDSWNKFTAFSESVLRTFQSFKLESVSLRNDGVKSDSHKDEDRFFAKYLTNQNLLQLQLSDSNFRRYVYLQMLILFQYLQSSVKFKQDSFVLSDEQTKWITNSRQKIYGLIKETPPNGAKFVEAVQNLLKREDQWNNWKNEGCPGLTSSTPATDSKNGQKEDEPKGPVSTRKRKRKLGDLIQDATKSGKFLMGNAALTRLWNICPDNLEACASAERDFLPSVEEYFGEAIEQLDPANQVEETYKKVNDGQWGWRALRLLAKKTPHFFTYSNNPIAKLPDYLENMLKRMATSGGIKSTTNSTSSETTTDVKMENGQDGDKSEKDEPKEEENPPVAFVCTAEQLEKLAEKLSGFEKWTSLAPKLGVTDLEKLYEEKKITETKDKILLMLQKWSQQEGSGATNEEIIYILEGLKMADAAKEVFPEKE